MTSLEKRFPGDCSSRLFKGGAEWTKHPSRLVAGDLTNETVEVLVKEFSDHEIEVMGGKLESEAIIRWGIDNGWLPADEKECLAVNLDPLTACLQYFHPLVALGSSAVNKRGDRCVSALGSEYGTALFETYLFEHGWSQDHHFLFVRKATFVLSVEVCSSFDAECIKDDTTDRRSWYYRTRVNRGPFPSMTDLEDRFSKSGGVSRFFDGTHEWTKHPSRLTTGDLTDEVVEVLVKEFSIDEIEAMGGTLKSEAIVQWGIDNGWLPADEKESLAVHTNPLTQMLLQFYPMVALGSSTMGDRERRFVSMLSSYDGDPLFGTAPFEREWTMGYRFLFVRKAT
jgi:hypothetical protein